MSKILIGSPINKPPQILELFLNGLLLLKGKDIEVEYCFIDDNNNLRSSDILGEFIKKNNGIILDINNRYIDQEWEVGEHSWSYNKIEKIANYKNCIIDYFLGGNYDYMFFVDSDLVLHPNTLMKLIEDDKDIVANIFWTTWSKGGRALPQVWVKDFYTLFDAHMLRPVSDEEAVEEENRFLDMLRVPGVYKVGGLGACTLIRRGVLEKGVHFGNIYNLSFWGEDRSFCIRAAALGYELYVDTHYPAFHIFTQDEIKSGEIILSSYK
ncbi:MAG: glycosyltransferase [Clostridium sp.]